MNILPIEWSYMQLATINLDSEMAYIDLELIDPINQIEQSRRLDGLIYLRISKSPNEEGPYVIGQINLFEIDDDKDIFSKLNYGFSRERGDMGDLFSLHLEGDIVIDCVSSGYEITAL